MLKGSFFDIRERMQAAGYWEYHISLNGSHPIYEAHFPNNPVTPGVCIVQLVKEISSDCCSKDFFIRTIKKVKFLSVLNPLQHQDVQVRFTCKISENGLYLISAVISSENLIFSKVNLQLEEVISANE